MSFPTVKPRYYYELRNCENAVDEMALNARMIRHYGADNVTAPVLRSPEQIRAAWAERLIYAAWSQAETIDYKRDCERAAAAMLTKDKHCRPYIWRQLCDYGDRGVSELAREIQHEIGNCRIDAIEHELHGWLGCVGDAQYGD